MKVNGKEITLVEDKSISALLKDLNINENRVVVELNNEIIIKDIFSEVNLKNEDTIEIISFVGGG